MKAKDAMKDFRLNEGASEDAIRHAITALGYSLPSDYVQFLRENNGGIGFIGGNYIDLWRIEELIDRNHGYRVDEFVPGLLFFGSDGGGEAFAFDLRDVTMPVARISFIPMELRDVIAVASNFTGFLDRAMVEYLV